MQAWTNCPIKELYVGFWDGPHATPKDADRGAIYLGIKNITETGRLDFSDIKYIAEEDLDRWNKRVTPQTGDIVFTYEATLHRYAILPEGFRGCLGRRLALIRPDTSKVDTRFLHFYFLSSYWREVVSRYVITGATVDRIPIIRFPDFEVQIPPLPVQRRIASILSAYDDLIENNTRRIALLEESMRLLYREWFVRLRFPGHEAVKMMDGLPEGWERKTLGDIVMEMRRQLDPSDVEADIPYVGLEHIPRISIALAKWGMAGDVTSSKFRFEKGEILFGKIRPYFHKVVFALMDGICSSDTIVYKPKQPEYFGLALAITSSQEFVSYTSKTSNEGSKMPRANATAMKNYPIHIPDLKILADFNRFTIDITSQISTLVMMNQKLSEARDLLLPRLMSGEIAV